KGVRPGRRDAVYLVPFIEQEFRKIRSILPGNSGDQGDAPSGSQRVVLAGKAGSSLEANRSEPDDWLKFRESRADHRMPCSVRSLGRRRGRACRRAGMLNGDLWKNDGGGRGSRPNDDAGPYRGTSRSEVAAATADAPIVESTPRPSAASSETAF